MTLRIAFDLDETLGVPQIDGNQITGFIERDGLRALLFRLQHYELCIWTVSNRSYLDKVLSYGLGEFFPKTYSWDEKPCSWKDVRAIGADYLVDDGEYHREAAREHGIEDRSIIVPAFGSPEDVAEPLGWVQHIEARLLGTRGTC